MDERITKYDHLYKMMAEGSDPEKMHIFGKAERHIFHELSEKDPTMADAWLAMLAPVEWNNYLTEEEAEEIGEKIVYIHTGYKWWEGTKEDILESDNPELNEFVFASAMAKRARGW